MHSISCFFVFRVFFLTDSMMVVMTFSSYITTKLIEALQNEYIANPLI